MSWVATAGALGLLGATLVERVVPIMPSYALLVAIGIAARHGEWDLSTAILASTLGGVMGGLITYAVGAAFEQDRSMAFIKRAGRWFGVSGGNIDNVMVQLHASERLFVFGSQLIPGVRLIAPGVAGALRLDTRSFTAFSTIGVGLWNLVFISVGYLAARAAAGVNTSALAFKTVLVLLAAELMLAAVWRWASVRRNAL